MIEDPAVIPRTAGTARDRLVQEFGRAMRACSVPFETASASPRRALQQPRNGAGSGVRPSGAAGLRLPVPVDDIGCERAHLHHDCGHLPQFQPWPG